MASLFVGHATQKSKLHNLQYDEGGNHMAEEEEGAEVSRIQNHVPYVPHVRHVLSVRFQITNNNSVYQIYNDKSQSSYVVWRCKNIFWFALVHSGVRITVKLIESTFQTIRR